MCPPKTPRSPVGFPWAGLATALLVLEGFWCSFADPKPQNRVTYNSPEQKKRSTPCLISAVERWARALVLTLAWRWWSPMPQRGPSQPHQDQLQLPIMGSGLAASPFPRSWNNSREPMGGRWWPQAPRRRKVAMPRKRCLPPRHPSARTGRDGAMTPPLPGERWVPAAPRADGKTSALPRASHCKSQPVVSGFRVFFFLFFIV